MVPERLVAVDASGIDPQQDGDAVTGPPGDRGSGNASVEAEAGQPAGRAGKPEPDPGDSASIPSIARTAAEPISTVSDRGQWRQNQARHGPVCRHSRPGRCPLYVRAQPEPSGLAATQRTTTARSASARYRAYAQASLRSPAGKMAATHKIPSFSRH